MTTYAEIEQLATSLPETVVSPSYGGTFAVKVNKKMLLRHAEEHDGRADPVSGARNGEVIALKVGDVGEKAALLAADPAVFFTTPHYDGYPTVLVRLGLLSFEQVRELVLESWFALAPKRAIRAYENG